MPPLLPPSSPLFHIQLNQRIDPHNRNTRLHRTLQLPHLGHARLQHPRLDLIHHFPPQQIEPVVLVAAALLQELCFFARGGRVGLVGLELGFVGGGGGFGVGFGGRGRGGLLGGGFLGGGGREALRGGVDGAQARD